MGETAYTIERTRTNSIAYLYNIIATIFNYMASTLFFPAKRHNERLPEVVCGNDVKLLRVDNLAI